MRTVEPPNRRTATVRAVTLAALLMCAAVVSFEAAGKAVPAVAIGGTGLLYVGGYAGKISILDEATEKLVGEIPMKTGIPLDMVLSRDRKRFYAITTFLEDIDVVDIPSRQVVDTFRLTEGNRRVRINAFEVDPAGQFMVMSVRAATRLTDRWDIGPSELLLYDLKAHKVSKKIPWPNGEERDRANLLFSPDGKYLYFFADDVFIYDTATYEVVDKWELSRPVEDGFGRLELGGVDILNEEPGYFTGLFTSEDPVQHRQVTGIARVNLSEKRVDFYAVGPAQDQIRTFTLAPGRKLAYAILSRIGHYEFWTFDLTGRRLQSRTEFAGRPRLAVKTSTNGKLLYLYQAGNTIDLWDASTYKYLRTVTLAADMTTDLFVIPAK